MTSTKVQPLCSICTRDLKQGGATCTDCVDTLVGDLFTLAWLAAELQTTRTKQARIAGNTGLRNGGSPLGYHLGAATAHTQLHDMLTGWEWTLRSDTATAIALHLAHQTDRWRNSPHTHRLAHNVEHHTKAALEIINPLADDQTYGICGEENEHGEPCTAHLYGPPDADWVRCRKCDTQHDARRRMHQLERRMRVLYFRAATLARLLPRLIDRPVSASNIRNWKADGKPIKTETDDDGFTTFHCGDTIDVALRVPKRDRPSKKAG